MPTGRARPKSIAMPRFGLIAAALLLALGACSSGGDARRPAPAAAAPSAGAAAGVVKVGAPYVVRGVRYVPRVEPGYDEVGVASWYGPGFHGRRTANGDIYDMEALTAAHTTLPMPSRVRVTNLENGASVVLTVNDRGPFAKGRIIDVSRRAARELGFLRQGIAHVRVQAIGGPPAARAGSGGRYYVEAGAFANPDNAWRLRARLSRIADFAIARARTSRGLLHRVRAGPLESPARAAALADRLRGAGHRDVRTVTH